jgi:hypothetical protein
MTAQSVAVTIYHNPACGTSRNTLALILNAGKEPTIIEYLKTPSDRATLQNLFDAWEWHPERSCVTRARPMTVKCYPGGGVDLVAFNVARGTWRLPVATENKDVC